MNKTFTKLNVINSIILFLTTISITFFRILQLKYFTNFEIACNNFKNINFLSLKINSNFLNYCIIVLTLIYISFLIFYTTKKNKFCLKYGILKISRIENENNENILVKIFLILAASVSFITSIAYLNSYKLELELIIILIFLFQLFFSFYFLHLFFCINFKKFKKDNILNLIFITPVILGFIRIISATNLVDFLFLTKREFLLYNLKVATITLFFFYFGKFLIGFNSKNNEKFMNFFGYSSIFFTFISVIPRFIFYFINNEKFESAIAKKVYMKNIDILNTNNFIIIDLIILIFIIIFMKKLTFKNTLRNIK